MHLLYERLILERIYFALKYKHDISSAQFSNFTWTILKYCVKFLEMPTLDEHVYLWSG